MKIHMALSGWTGNAGDGENREAKCAFNEAKDPTGALSGQEF